MDEFKNQLTVFVPLTANCIIKLENQLNSVDEEIKICRERLNSKRLQMNYDNVKLFVSNNLINYQPFSRTLSKAIGSIDVIYFEFEKFEFEILDYKRTNFVEIQRKIDEFVEVNDWNTACLAPLLDKLKEAFNEFDEDRKQNLVKKGELDACIPLVHNQLIERKEHCTRLEEQYLNLNDFANHKQSMFDIARSQLLGNC